MDRNHEAVFQMDTRDGFDNRSGSERDVRVRAVRSSQEAVFQDAGILSHLGSYLPDSGKLSFGLVNKSALAGIQDRRDDVFKEKLRDVHKRRALYKNYDKKHKEYQVIQGEQGLEAASEYWRTRMVGPQNIPNLIEDPSEGARWPSNIPWNYENAQIVKKRASRKRSKLESSLNKRGVTVFPEGRGNFYRHVPVEYERLNPSVGEMPH